MKKALKLVMIIVTIFTALNITLSQGVTPLTYNVTASNFIYLDTITNLNPYTTFNWNVIEFDIYIQQTNTPAVSSEIMRYDYGQYFLNINFGGLLASDTAGGYASLRYIQGSSTFTNLNAIPVNPKCVAILPNTDIGGTYNGVLGGSIQLSANNPLGSTSDVQISGTFPGTKAGRYRLKKRTGFFPSVHPQMRWRKAPAVSGTNPDPVSKIICYNGYGGAFTDVTNKGTFRMDTIAPPLPPTTTAANLNLKILMEGMYYPLFNQMSRKDTVTVILRNSTFPYEIIDSAKVKIDSISFTGLFHFNLIPIDTHYLVIKHHNCIDIWSKTGGVPFLNSNTVNYDFTTSASQAYGDNMVRKGTKFCLYSGNVNHDAIIDASDISQVENDKTAGLTGYVPSDVNGDYFVDATDLSITDNNKDTGIIVITP